MPRKLRRNSHKYYTRRVREPIPTSNDEPPVHFKVRLPLTEIYHAEFHTLSEMKGQMELFGVPNRWCIQDQSGTQSITLTKAIDHSSVAAVVIEEGFIMKAGIDGQYAQHSPLMLTSAVMSLRAVYDFLEFIDDHCNICEGNEVKNHEDVLCDEILTMRMGNKVIYQANCHLFCEIPSVRCVPCTATLRAFNARRRRRNQSSTARDDLCSHTRYSVLSKEEMKERLKLMHEKLVNVKKQRDSVVQRVEEEIERQGMQLNREDEKDMEEIMRNNEAELNKMVHNCSQSVFERLFWEQQIEATTRSDRRGMRWHPLMIRWCIYIRHQSNKAYQSLQQVIRLPSQRLLRDYTHHTKATTGFSNEVDQQLYQAAGLQSIEDYKKHVIILIDEIHIKEGLVFEKHTGNLIGFTSMGNVHEEINKLQQTESNSSTFPPELLANTVTTMMVRGLFSDLEFPYAYFPGRKVAGYMLYDLLWEGVARLESIGFKVMGCTADGASVNRKLIKLHDGKQDLVHKTTNHCSVERREFFFFSDPPHLIKTTRNCWSSSTRLLWNKGNHILWDHLKGLYENNRSQSGLALLPRLKYEHIYLTNFSKMRVDLAAQALSESVSLALTKYGGNEAKETAIFALMFDRFFDCVNVQNYTDGKHKRKVFQNPYRSADDFRLKWLEDTFLVYLDEWEASVNMRPNFTDSQKQRMLLSQETMRGLRITTRSFIELVKYLFKQPGVESFLSRKICQDPLEKFFGCQRQIGRSHDNPTVEEFEKNTQILRVVNSFCKASVKSNCRGNTDLSLANKDQYLSPLPKRRRTQTDHGDTTASILPDSLDVSTPSGAMLKAIVAVGNNTSHLLVKSVNDKPEKNSFFIEFSTQLVKAITCIIEPRLEKYSVSGRESIYVCFHEVRSSDAFHDTWKAFLRNIEINVPPSLYQHITHNLLNILIDYFTAKKTQLTSKTSPVSPHAPQITLNNIEENALRYFAGYICRKITNCIYKSKNPHKSKLLLFMSNVSGIEDDDDTEERMVEESEEWTRMRDRGGLYHINGSCFEFFIQMELELRVFFNFKCALMTPIPKEEIVEVMKRSTNVLNAWHVMTEDVQYDLLVIDEIYTTFLNEFVTVRGFYFADSIVEAYKKASKKGLQKSKGLRKTI